MLYLHLLRLDAFNGGCGILGGTGALSRVLMMLYRVRR